MKPLLLLLLSVVTALSQPLSFGLKGGVPVTDAFKITGGSGYFSDSKRYTVGPTMELNLPFRISVEFDALYKPLRYGVANGAVGSATTGSSWEFPLLMKYRLTGGLVRPYLDAGLAFRNLRGFDEGLPELRERSSAGAVIGGGLELRAPGIRLSGELRYTRWGSTSIRSALGDLTSQLNQAEFLVGITF